jgi:iron complex outermembrane receptor protein
VQHIAAGKFVLTGRLAATFQRHDHVFITEHERDRHTNVFAEVAMQGATGRHTWVGGAAFERESFDPIEVERFAYFHRVPGVFAQDDIRWNDWPWIFCGDAAHR